MNASILDELINQFRAERVIIANMQMSVEQRIKRIQWENDCNRIHEAFTNVGWNDFANYFKDAMQ